VPVSGLKNEYLSGPYRILHPEDWPRPPDISGADRLGRSVRFPERSAAQIHQAFANTALTLAQVMRLIEPGALAETEATATLPGWTLESRISHRGKGLQAGP